MAQVVWDAAISLQLANNNVNTGECSSRIATLQTYCEALNGGNTNAQTQCEQYDSEIIRLNAEVAKYSQLETSLNNRLYASLTGDEQAALTTYYTLLNDESFFRNVATSASVVVSELKNQYDAALQSTSDPNAVPDAVKKDLFIRIFYNLKSGV